MYFVKDILHIKQKLNNNYKSGNENIENINDVHDKWSYKLWLIETKVSSICRFYNSEEQHKFHVEGYKVCKEVRGDSFSSHFLAELVASGLLVIALMRELKQVTY